MTSKNKAGSVDRFLMPLLGPGRAFFRVRLVEKGESAARFHSHSAVDEDYLILAGKGTLRYNGKETEVKPGDLVGKPAGPEAATQLIADRGRGSGYSTWRCGTSGPETLRISLSTRTSRRR